jgi:hypothetical membrane protein
MTNYLYHHVVLTSQMRKKSLRLFKKQIDIAGLLFFLAGIIIFMGIITAESYYPSDKTYTTRQNEISDLGATKPPNSIITQPSATIFNTTMILTGIMIILATLLIHGVYEKYIISVPLGVLGLGILGVGIFPGNMTPWHPIFAFITFSSGGLAAILSYRITKAPLNYVFVILGVIALFFLAFHQLFVPFLGNGGTERFIAYPILFWIIGLGTYLIGATQKKTNNERDS